MVKYMIFKEKRKILTLLLSSIFIIFLIACTVKIMNKNNDNNIIVKYVNKIESDLYSNLFVYDYDINTDQYIINENKFTKFNILYEIFYYYNDRYNYSLDSIEFDDNDKSIIIIKLRDGNNFNITDFKIMKLTYNQLNIKKIKLLFDDETIII